MIGFWLILALLVLAWMAMVFILATRESILLYAEEKRQQPLLLTVRKRTDIDQEHFLLELEASGCFANRLPAFQPGQYLNLEIPVNEKQRIKRAYSLSSWSARPKHYTLGIKREEQGKASGWMHRQLKTGSQIRVSRPRGQFILQNAEARAYVFIAGGIGITPLRAMIQFIVSKHKHKTGCPPVYLFYSCRESQQFCYFAEFRQLASIHRNFHFIPLLTGSEQSWNGERGRVDSNRLQQQVREFAQASYYLCASSSMMESLCGQLYEAGISKQQIHFESFGVSSHSGTACQHPIELNGQVFHFDNEPSLFHAIENEGFPIDGDCRSGSCGRCKTNLIAGKVRYLNQPEIRLKADEILPCCCLPESKLILRNIAFAENEIP
ncbi:MAG: 2Fe-2S iron-sulfur cluster-binding protein [Mangrovibacterium sp.]